MAGDRRPWTRGEQLVALSLYLQLPFGRLHRGTPEIKHHAQLLERTPSALAMKLTNFASIDDSIQRAGLRNVAQADRDLWAELKHDWPAIAEAIDVAKAQFGIATTDDVEADAPQERTPVGEDIVASTKVRRGQALFRSAVLSAYRNRCCITGLADPRLLVASHIVPWRDDPANRLNPTNGLCLNALHDRAFDRGLITFDADLRLVLSPQLVVQQAPFAQSAFTTHAGMQIKRPDKFAPDPDLLAHHRDHIFLR